MLSCGFASDRFRYHVVLESMWEEAHHLEPDAVLTVVLMATGHVIARQGTGRTSAIDVGKEAT